MKNYFQRQDIIDIQQTFKHEKIGKKLQLLDGKLTLKGSAQAAVRGSALHCTGSMQEVHCNALFPSLGYASDSKPFLKAI